MVLRHLLRRLSSPYDNEVNQPHPPTGPYAEERRYRRFDLHFPVSLSYPQAGIVRELETISRNVSIGGLLVTASDQIPLRTPVNLTVNVVGSRFRHPVTLLGEGEVVRVESLGPGAGFAIAVECRDPITQMDDHLPA